MLVPGHRPASAGAAVDHVGEQRVSAVDVQANFGRGLNILEGGARARPLKLDLLDDRGGLGHLQFDVVVLASHECDGGRIVFWPWLVKSLMIGEPSGWPTGATQSCMLLAAELT